MSTSPAAYRGDSTLARLLADAGLSVPLDQLRELIAGANAAPDGQDPHRWIGLLGEGLPADLVEQLKALRRLMPPPADPARGDRATRLAALRAELHRRGLDGFVVPRGDEHQGEYVPLNAQRLAWLTGFTGSAGIAVVLAQQAAVFVDGRYTLQVAAEVPSELFEFRHLVDEFQGDWAAARLPRGARLGFDPWLHTEAWAERMRGALAAVQAELAPVDDNPIDAIWQDRPPPPLGRVVAHPEVFAGIASADKRTRIAGDLQRDRLSAAVLTQPDSIAWLLNVRGSDVPSTPLPLSYALIRASGEVDWFVDRRKLTPGLELSLGNQVAVRPPSDLPEALDALSGERVRADPAWTSVWILDRLTRAGAVLDKGNDPCALPKACKNPVELEGMRAAHRRDGAAMARFLAWFDEEAPKGHLTEIDASDRLLEFRRQVERFRDISFDSISGAGPNGAIVHYRASPATNRRIEPDSVYLIDSGGQYADGTTDITRTLAVGTPPPEARRHFTLVLKGHIALSEARFPKGTVGSQLDALARAPLWRAGLDYDHGTGHGVGSFLSVHEGPQRIAKVHNTTPLMPGMVLSNEPGYYKTGAYGIRIENLIVVTPVTDIAGAERETYGFETLTLCPIDRRLVDVDLLTPDERLWLDAYHDRVREELASDLDATTRAWLERATSPL